MMGTLDPWSIDALPFAARVTAIGGTPSRRASPGTRNWEGAR